MTSRWKGGELSGYQMTCCNPQHNLQKKCTKEVSLGVAGGAPEARRMLKSWAAWGCGEASRTAHAGVWKVVVEHAKADFSLPSEEDLDKHQPTQWDSDLLPVPLGGTLSAPAGLVQGVALLGEPGPDVPGPIHAEMERLASLGVLPVTTLEQRLRNKGIPGSTYGVPQFFAAARRHGYLSPNIEAPSGYRWVNRNGVCILSIKGGCLRRHQHVQLQSIDHACCFNANCLQRCPSCLQCSWSLLPLKHAMSQILQHATAAVAQLAETYFETSASYLCQ